MNQIAKDFIADLQNLAQLDYTTALQITEILLEKDWRIYKYEMREGKTINYVELFT